jgi:hypothetical protein
MSKSEVDGLRTKGSTSYLVVLYGSSGLRVDLSISSMSEKKGKGAFYVPP